MQKKESRKDQKLSNEEITEIVNKVDEAAQVTKRQYCEPKHTCDDKFDCKDDDFVCAVEHTIKNAE